ncbi:LacI family DNA-binding transcriptional regulator [Subtercola sp. YIM 133946]|uniref:LacI family DNA-binding transcriptional regulator n=1 Tax=Subtercola sp. YIM 133946 TaxID=3118909 RepID=UPI002F92E5BE
MSGPADTGDPAADRRGARKPPATIYDVARHLGVSPSTVSRALNKPGRINAATEQRIRDGAAELGYQLNPMARSLPTRRTGTLALIVSDITNPVYFGLVRGAERAAADAGYTLVLAESQETADREAEIASRLLVSVDGLVLVASRLDEPRLLALAERKPVILVNRRMPGLPGLVADVGSGIRSSLDHLRALGHRRIAYLPGPSTSWMSDLRWQTIRAESAARGLAAIELATTTPTVDGGRAALPSLLAAGLVDPSATAASALPAETPGARTAPTHEHAAAAVTAVFAYNDLVAIGLLQACREASIDVPGTLSIIGFDDIFGSDFTSPPITTIRTPLDSLGDEAVRALLADLAGAPPEARSPLETEFVPRGSTASAASRA